MGFNLLFLTMRFLILCLLLSNFSFSSNLIQKNNSDLFKENFHNQIDGVYNRFWQNLDDDLVVAEECANQLLKIAGRIDEKEVFKKSYDCFGQLMLVKKEYDHAKSYIEKIKQLSVGSEKEYSQYYYALGKVFYYQENLDSAIYFWDKALLIFQEGKQNKYIINTKLNIGAALQQKRIESALKNSPNEDLIEELSRLGVVYLDLADYSKSEHYYKKALAVLEQSGDKQLKSDLLFQMGEVSFYQGYYEDAIGFYQKSITLNEDSSYVRAVNNLKIGRSYIKLGRYEEAEIVLLKAVDGLKGSGDKIVLIDAISYLSGLYYRMDRPVKALSYFGLLEDTYDDFEEGEKQSDFKREIIESSFLIRDSVEGHFFTSLREQETINEIYESESGFQIAKKENEILLIKQKELIAKRNNQLLWLVLVLAVISIAFIMQQNSKLKQNKLLIEIKSKYKDLQIQKTKLALSKKNEEFKHMADNLVELKQNFNPKQLNELLKELKKSSLVERNWGDYLKTYEEMNPTFFAFLESNEISLTFSEKRLCAMVHQGLTIGAIAHMLNNQKKSVEGARYRLRKKLKLSEKDDLLEYIVKHS